MILQMDHGTFFIKYSTDRIIIYEYEEKIDDILNSNADSIPLYSLLPQEMQIIKQDSIYCYFSDCFTSMDINTIITKENFLKVAIYPFQVEPQVCCDRSMIMYFDDEGHFLHFYNDRENKETLSNQHPGIGLYGYKKEFLYGEIILSNCNSNHTQSIGTQMVGHDQA